MPNHLSLPAASPYQRLWPWAALAVLLALRVVYAFVMQANSDESQHLHVVWSWSQGLIPYRDFFDNHTPLFQMLCAPFLALFGERADILVPMRLLMIPLYFGSLWVTWRIGRSLWSPRVAIAAVFLIALFPKYFSVSVEFRTDDLWALLWLSALAVAVCGPFTVRRAGVAGLFAGAAIATSMKTLLLVGAAGLAGASILVLLRLRGENPLARLPARPLLLGALAMCVVPALFALFFAWNGAWDAMLYNVFLHNMVANPVNRLAWFHPLLGLLYVPIVWLAWRGMPALDHGLWARRSVVLLTSGAYLVALYGFWPLLTRQDVMPVVSGVALAVAAGLLGGDRQRTQLRRWGTILIVALVVAELATVISNILPWRDRQQAFADSLARVLRLAAPQDYVLDPKGAAIFRKRPVYWVFEGITRERIRQGSIPDDIAERLAETATHVVIVGRYTQAAQAFIDRNYLALGGELRVAGQKLGHAHVNRPVQFTVTVPGDYAIVSADGIVAGTLDGTALVRSRDLAIGNHLFVPARSGDLALVWAPALARGIAPQELFGKGLE